MFAKLKDRLTGGASRLSGRTDLLEAACALCARVTYADGTADDNEVMATITLLTSHETLAAAFRQSDIEACINRMMDKAKGGIASRIMLDREIEQAKDKSSRDELEIIFLIGVDVASADGSIGPEERTALEKIGRALGFDLRNYADA